MNFASQTTGKNHVFLFTNPVKVRDKVGRFDDVVTGYDSIEGYINNFNYDGAMIGRYANRIGGARYPMV